MPRTGRGGKRVGNPGTAYANRTDLNAAKPSNYGRKAADARSTSVIPLPTQSAGGGAAGPGIPRGPSPVPGQLPLDAPSARPGEPLTAGLSMGAGPGPSPYTPALNSTLEMLRAVYQTNGNEAVAELIRAVENGDV